LRGWASGLRTAPKTRTAEAPSEPMVLLRLDALGVRDDPRQQGEEGLRPQPAQHIGLGQDAKHAPLAVHHRQRLQPLLHETGNGLRERGLGRQRADLPTHQASGGDAAEQPVERVTMRQMIDGAEIHRGDVEIAGDFAHCLQDVVVGEFELGEFVLGGDRVRVGWIQVHCGDLPLGSR